MTETLRASCQSNSHRWFVTISTCLLVGLCLAILLAALLLLRRGNQVRYGQVTGSSMEPILAGPRLQWTCPSCKHAQSFNLDTCKSHQPFRCQRCEKSDMQSAMDMEESWAIDNRTLAGEKLMYGPLRMMRSLRTKGIQSGEVHATGLTRGDIVVFQSPADSAREVKRLVGLPGEHIAIADGDLFVDHVRFCKSISQALRQAILVQSADDGLPTGPIDNRLPSNAHDSHEVVLVKDFGIAMRLAESESEWSLEIVLQSAVAQCKAEIWYKNRELRIAAAGETRQIRIENTESVSWVVVAMVDGDFLIGSPTDEWLRSRAKPDGALEFETDPISPPLKLASHRTPISIVFRSGEPVADRTLVFRDIYYRGQSDAATQAWEAGDHVIVLGDNVSISDDSRQRWHEGLGLTSIKGVAIEPSNPIEGLLRQSERK